ncbi:hypothetical protein CPB85DRAFT_1299452 [Mucidula mucida]|nr:hypothetical protein CPB85DRAFT_1299452 [Mucidula mucida]
MSSVAASPSAPRSPTLQVRTPKPMEERRHMQATEREPSRAPGPQLRHVEESRENPTQQEADYRSPPREHRSPRTERRDPPRLAQDEAGPQQDARRTESPRQDESHRPDPPQDSPRKRVECRASPPIQSNVHHPTAALDALRERSNSEYETGQVTCDQCGVTITIRNEVTGSFTMDHWEAHRSVCPPPPSLASAPPTKRRRAKRTEEERITYLNTDPYVAQFEAYRVLCKNCDKWIRLRPNSTYCSIPWDAHRKSCLTKKITNKNTYALEQRNKSLEKDPDARKFDAERVLCAVCDTWIQVPVPDERQVWQAHKAACRANAGSSSSSSVSVIAVGHLRHSRPVASVSQGPPQSLSSHHSHNHVESGGPPPHFNNESRRRNAEQRAATLRADSLILHVEPNRVFCSLCQKWVQLRQDSSYCAYPWLQHRTKCLLRSQKRAAKERVHSGERMEKIEVDAESEDAEGSWDEEEPQAPPMSAPPHLQTSRHVSHHAPPHRDTMAERYSNGQHHQSASHPIPPPRQPLVQPSDSYLDLDAPMPEDRWEEYDLREVARGVGIIEREGARGDARDEDGRRGEAPLRIELEGDMVRPR